MKTFKTIISIAVLTLTAAAAAAEALPPRVEVIGRDGSENHGYLIAFQNGILDLQLDSGEHASTQIEQIKTVRFMPPKAHETPSPEKHVWTSADSARLRQLTDKNRENPQSLSSTELEEMALLMALAPIKRPEEAIKAAREQAAKGPAALDSYIAGLELKLRIAPNEAVARQDLLLLAAGYHTKQLPPAKISESLHADIKTILKPRIREAISNKPPEFIESWPHK